MTLQNSVPIAWRPKGLTDALDSTDSIPGSMSNLQNLVPDPTTAHVWQCRPASDLLIDLGSSTSGVGPFSSGFSSGFQHTFFPGGAAVGPISCGMVVGDVFYGLVGGPSGFDYPFAFNLATNLPLTVTNFMDTTKLPRTQPQTGEWVPPTMAVVGAEIEVTHPGFLGGGTNIYFGWFDISTPTAPVWNAGNLNGAVTFLFPPDAVQGFNGRAYWLSNPPSGQPAAIFSDILAPRTVTNATQIITFEDSVVLTALAPLQLNNQLGGIVQALIVFKGAARMYQITGDAASTTNPLSRNTLNVATGTNSPGSIAATPKGLLFAAPDGLRLLDFNAQISDPIGWEGQGKVLPFLFSGTPSRAVAASTGTLYRLTIQDTTLLNAPFVEYWFDIVRGIVSGPHTFPSNVISPWNNTFIKSARGVDAKLWRSDAQQGASSTFVENGTQLQWMYVTSQLPDTDQMQENAMVETTVYMGMESNINYPVTATGPDGSIIGSASIQLAAPTPLWGTAIWGAFTWGGQQGVLFPRPIAWPYPIVFRRMQLGINGQSSNQVKLGAWHCRYEMLGYLQQSLVA